MIIIFSFLIYRLKLAIANYHKKREQQATVII